ncbi:PREDICTED: uncharacterized protein LOC106804828 isoform X1 [Priapulus caudatus]|uniref:Uncharacterized protein LOC106804828 isoform X1 n=1 Tax=Priapulus caudatus TaxID=37621 RepID=A0ABM1DNZ2_PRICU|nr:PREDICTED: uncharacterized protein LOC106804828 isoform X1 [Priapulus caudatus]
MTPVYFVALLAFSLHTTTVEATRCYECQYSNHPGGDLVTSLLSDTFNNLGLNLNLDNSTSSEQCADKTTLMPDDDSKTVNCEGACYKFKFSEDDKTWVARGCFQMPVEEKCEKQKQQDGEVWTCVCSGDHCNGAIAHSFTLAALLLTLFSTALLL